MFIITFRVDQLLKTKKTNKKTKTKLNLLHKIFFPDYSLRSNLFKNNLNINNTKNVLYVLSFLSSSTPTLHRGCAWCHQYVYRLFCAGIYNYCRLLKIQYVIAIHLMRWLTNFYDFRFKSTATAAIGIHSTKAWLSQFGEFHKCDLDMRTIKRAKGHKILFQTWKKCQRKLWNALDCFSAILHESSMSFGVA